MTTLSTPLNETGPAVESTHVNPNYILALTLIATSFGAVFIRFALNEGMSPLLIAAGRLSLATLVFTPMVWKWHRQDIANMSWHMILYSMAAGVFLGLHFIAFATSLQKTSVLINQVFANMAPLCVALLELFLLKKRQPQAVWFGIVVSILGCMVIAFGNAGGVQSNSNVIIGSLLALLGCVLSSIYMVIGRHVRAGTSFVPYVWIVFGSGAMTAICAVIVSGVPFTGYSPKAYFWVLMVALVPQLVGHSGYNYLVGYFSATFISLVNLTNVVTSAILAFILFHEVPSLSHEIGSFIIISGVALAVIGQKGRVSARLWWEKRKQRTSHSETSYF
jgi:drug/metabolite transporter (DMT)-like permease